MKKIILFLLVSVFTIFSFNSLSFAEEKLTIFISGQSHSSLYHCSCPYNPEGGVARRATLINQTRKDNNNILLLEAGGSFAGGGQDANTQTTELDKQRTKYYMQSLAQMGYDAFLVSSKELSFGEDFLNETMSGQKLNYLSANLKGNFLPYIIKDVAGVKIAIIGITDEKVTTLTQMPYESPKNVLANVIKEVKEKQKADFVIVLSYLSEEESKDIINQIKDVNIWVSSNNPFKSASNQDINGVSLIVPAWEVRKLTKINLDISTLKIENIENISLNTDISDDPGIAAIIPGCFTNNNCRKPGFIGSCKNGGALEAKCDFVELKPANLTLIKPTTCKTCNYDRVINDIKSMLPNLTVEYLEENNKSAQDLIKKLNIKMLPAYLIEENIDEQTASKLGKAAKKVDKYYMLEPSFTGVSFIVGREKIQDRLDLFFDVGSKDIVKILDVLQTLKNKRKDIDVHLNFLAVEDAELGLIAKGEKYEVEEFLRFSCINKYNPDQLWPYLSCRLADIGSSWWDSCAIKFGIDPAKIKTCAQADEGVTLLKDFIKLTQELEIVFGPTFLVNNQEVFSSEGIPSVEEIERLFEQ